MFEMFYSEPERKGKLEEKLSEDSLFIRQAAVCAALFCDGFIIGHYSAKLSVPSGALEAMMVASPLVAGAADAEAYFQDMLRGESHDIFTAFMLSPSSTFAGTAAVASVGLGELAGYLSARLL